MRTLQPFGKSLGFGGRLIDDSASVDDVDKAARDLRVLYQREEPKDEDGCLAEPGREITGAGEVARDEPPVERTLPREGPITREQLEVSVEVHGGLETRKRTWVIKLPVDAGFPLRLIFTKPVCGPIAIGYGSHFGLGLFGAEGVQSGDRSL